MATWTKEQIQTLSAAELRAIARSTVSTSCSSYWQEAVWARDEIARRNRLRNERLGKNAIVKASGYITAKE